MMASSENSSSRATPEEGGGRRRSSRTTILPPLINPSFTVSLVLLLSTLLLGSTSGFSPRPVVVVGPSRPRQLGPRATFTDGGGVTPSTAASVVVVSPWSSSSSSSAHRHISRSGMMMDVVTIIPSTTTPVITAGWGAALPVNRRGASTETKTTATAGRMMVARRRRHTTSPLLMSTGDASDDDSDQVGDGEAGNKSSGGGINGGSSSSSSSSSPPPRDTVFDLRTTLTLISAQALLIVCAAILAVFLGTPNLGLGSNFSLDKNSLVVGAICTIPLFGLALGLDAVEDKFPPLKDVTRATQRSVLGLLGERRRPLLATVTAIALGLVAGLGEEMLFRGVLQTELCSRFLFTPAASITLTSLAFGALHAVTPLYAILASLASAFFGVLLVRSDGNLAIPIVCHGLYDVGALLWAHYVVTGMTESERREVMDWTP